MLATFDALLAQPFLLLLVLGAGAMIGMGVDELFARMQREQRRAYWAGRNAVKRGPELRIATTRAEPVHDKNDVAADQLKCVMRAQFTSRPLLNRGELRLLAVIDAELAEQGLGWRAMGQVSLGEILASEDKDAYRAINSKRVDLLIVDAECRPLHAVEFQGSGHHLGSETAARDAVKKEALRRAGIGYVEVVAGDTPSSVRDAIKKLIRSQSSQTNIQPVITPPLRR